MRMTSAEKLILENQMQIMMSLSVLLGHKTIAEYTPARAVSVQVNKTSSVLHAAKVWSNE
jgi:uncharacterized protein YfbU (UPF0304 family)